MTTNKNCIERLYQYRNALFRLKYLGFTKVFSDNLADAVGVTSSQVRKDLSVFGSLGNKRGGYPVDDLIDKLNEILGKNKRHNVVILGAGNIGSSLMRYKGFETEGIDIVAAFDADPSKVNYTSEVPVLAMSEFKDFVEKRNDIQIGVLAVPADAAQQAVDQMIACGIKGVLNFSPVRLNVPENFMVISMNLVLELEKLIYFVNAVSQEEEARTS